MLSLCQGYSCKLEAWIIKRMISIVSRAAKRPHIPRSKEMRALMQEIGIEMESAGAFASMKPKGFEPGTLCKCVSKLS